MIFSDPMAPRFLQVGSVRRETYDTCTVQLNEAEPQTAFLPGQFNMLYLHGLGEVPISISGNPEDSTHLVHTTRAVGLVSGAIAGVHPGDWMGIRGPFGSPWPVQQATGNDVVLIAGGIGMAPLRPALYSILASRSQYGKVVLLYGARGPEDLLFRKELESWRARFDLDVAVTVEHAGTDWRGHVGFVTNLIPRAQFDPGNTIAMICGPEIMMRFTAQELTRRGMERTDIFVSMERNMKCGIGLCGHCQFGPKFVCKDGPVFCFDDVSSWLGKGEI